MTQSDIIYCNLSLCAWCAMQDHRGRERDGHTRSWRQRERFVVTYRIMEAERQSVVDRAISGVMCRLAELFM